MSFRAVATLLLVPPVNLILLAILGLVLRRRRIGPWLNGIALAGLLLLALPVTSDMLIYRLEAGLPTTGATTDPPGAIVILSGDIAVGRDGGTGGAPGWLTLDRMRAGAALQRRTHLPVLVTGGIVRKDIEPIAPVMARSMAEDFGVPVRWVEARSSDTWENAEFSADILRPEGIRAVYVVSDAWHLRRALIAMRHFGLDATPAPTQLDGPPVWRFDAFEPSVRALLMSYYALHEWIGCAFYALRS